MRYRYTSLPSQCNRFIENLTSPSTVVGNQGSIVGAPAIDQGMVCTGVQAVLYNGAGSIGTPAQRLAAISGCKLLTFAEYYTLTGTKVSLVSSVVGPNFVQATDARRPTINAAALNGHPGLVFAGGQVLDGVASLDLSGATSATTVVVFKDTVATASVIVEQGPNAVSNPGFFVATNDGAANRYASSARAGGATTRGYFVRDNAAFSIDEWDQDTTMVAADQIKCRINGVNQALTMTATTMSGALANAIMHLGARVGAVAPMTGEVVAVAVYAPRLSAGNQVLMRAAMSEYTGIPA